MSKSLELIWTSKITKRVFPDLNRPSRQIAVIKPTRSSENHITFSDDLFCCLGSMIRSKQTGGWCAAVVSVFFIIFKILGFRRPLVFHCLYELWLGCFSASNAIYFLNSCYINDEMLYNNSLSKYDEKLKWHKPHSNPLFYQFF